LNYAYRYLAAIAIVLALGQSAAARSTDELLVEFDAAKGKKLFALIPDLQQLGSSATPSLEAYALNTAKEARKRTIVLELVLNRKTPAAGFEMLQELLHGDPDARFKASCTEELGRRNYPGAKALLKKMLADKDENPRIQVGAALGLAEMGDDSGKEHAIKAVLQDEPWANNAIRVLEKLKISDPRIDQAARDRGTHGAKPAVRIGSLKTRLAGKSTPERIRLLDEALHDKDSFEVRKEAARHLAEMGTEEAGRRLAAAAKSPDSDFSGTAASGLRIGLENKKWTKEQVAAWMGQ